MWDSRSSPLGPQWVVVKSAVFALAPIGGRASEGLPADNARSRNGDARGKPAPQNLLRL